ncbi:MAG: site-specific DNA-methyltransferase [Planctomycetota bacterium]
MVEFQSRHRAVFADARALADEPPASAALVLTSPPYPMVALWDDLFAALDPGVAAALRDEDGDLAFDRMHRALAPIWAAAHRALVPGGILALNIGDATRSMGGRFRLWPNHARLLTDLAALGFDVLPDILWRKPNNSPTKFMGSGTLPAGAYVTYEHEYVLVLRKGANRPFRGADAERRRRSAVFWEERNLWFSDLWTDLRGRDQDLGAGAERARSAAFPFELAWRLVLMFSVEGDLVIDPFLGTGTTMAAALAAGRSSLGFERDSGLAGSVRATLAAAGGIGVERARRRLEEHRAFVARRQAEGRPPAHHNVPHDVPVMTRQERELRLTEPGASREDAGVLSVDHVRLGASSGGAESASGVERGFVVVGSDVEDEPLGVDARPHDVRGGRE